MCLACGHVLLSLTWLLWCTHLSDTFQQGSGLLAWTSPKAATANRVLLGIAQKWNQSLTMIQTHNAHLLCTS